MDVNQHIANGDQSIRITVGDVEREKEARQSSQVIEHFHHHFVYLTYIRCPLKFPGHLFYCSVTSKGPLPSQPNSYSPRGHHGCLYLQCLDSASLICLHLHVLCPALICHSSVLRASLSTLINQPMKTHKGGIQQCNNAGGPTGTQQMDRALTTKHTYYVSGYLLEVFSFKD